jgi:hypothetical protein
MESRRGGLNVILRLKVDVVFGRRIEEGKPLFIPGGNHLQRDDFLIRESYTCRESFGAPHMSKLYRMNDRTNNGMNNGMNNQTDSGTSALGKRDKGRTPGGRAA